MADAENGAGNGKQVATGLEKKFEWALLMVNARTILR